MRIFTHDIEDVGFSIRSNRHHPILLRHKQNLSTLTPTTSIHVSIATCTSMLARVLHPRHHLQIPHSVIRSITVLVMNDLVRMKSST
jgi:hypothetical protein